MMLKLLVAALSVVAGPALAGIEGLTDRKSRDYPRQLYRDGVAVLLIGNSSYREPTSAVDESTSAWAPLPGVQDDVGAVARMFRAQGADVTVAEDLTTSELRDAIASFVQSNGASEDRLLVVYYAGHGHAAMLTSDRPTGFLVGVDSPTPPVGAADGDLYRFLHREYYALSDLFSPLASLASRHVLVVIDSCFGGAVFESAASRVDDPSVLGQGGHQARVVQFLTSGQSNERVPDQSQFRRHFVRGLSGEADADKNGVVVGRELVEWVRAQSSNCIDDLGQKMSCAGPTSRPDFGIWRVGVDPPGDYTIAYGRSAGSVERWTSTPFRDDCTGCPELIRTDCNERGRGEVLFAGTREVSLAEWDACVAGRGCRRTLPGAAATRPIMPARGVSYQDAEGYARWLTCASGLAYRLPTAAEHACLARGPDSDDNASAAPGRASVCAGCRGAYPKGPSPVGSLLPNGYNLYDVFGNVWEWTSTCSVSGDALCEAGKRMIVGGSFATPEALIGPALAGAMPDDARFPTIGFRVVRESMRVPVTGIECQNLE